MRASVIVPARDAAATLPRTLAALAGQDFRGEWEAIVVDDGSRDGTDAVVDAARAAHEGRLRLVRQPPLGPGQARNAGAAVARGAVLAFCDADVFPAPGWLRHGIGALAEADLVQGHVLPDPAAAVGSFDRTLWITSEVGLWETANLFVRRELFERVGGFEEWIRPRRGKALAEDVWFGYRALRTGARSAFCAEALAHHAVFPRGAGGYVAERLRLRFFPAMAARMPELREHFLYRRRFLTARSARLDLAVVALLATRRGRSALPLAGALPYLREVQVASARSGNARLLTAAVDVVADLVGLGALAAGSLRYRSPVL